MKCNAVEPLLSQYIDGDLKGEQKKKVEAHLNTCLPCRGEMKALDQVIRGIRELPSPTPPQGFSQRVMSRIREEEVKPLPLWERLFLPFHIKIPIQAMALVLVTFLAAYLYRDNPAIQKEMAQMAPPKSRIFREDSKSKEKKQVPQTALRMEKDEAPSGSMTAQRVDKRRKNKPPPPDLTFEQEKTLFEKGAIDSPSQKPLSLETNVLRERIMVLEKSTSIQQRQIPPQILPIDNELVLLLDATTKRGTIRKKIDPLLRSMGGDYFDPEVAFDSSEKEDNPTEEILWIILPPSHLDRFKTALISFGPIREETPKTQRKIASPKKKELPSLRIKLIIRSPAP